LATIRIHSRKVSCRVLIAGKSGEETLFLDRGKFKDIPSTQMTEDVYTKWQFGLIKVEMLKKKLGEPVNKGIPG